MIAMCSTDGQELDLTVDVDHNVDRMINTMSDLAVGSSPS